MQPPDIWSDVFAFLLAETDVRLRAVYAFLVMQGLEIMEGRKKRKIQRKSYFYMGLR